METETFIVGQREFTCVPMNAFEANKLLLRIQKILLPAFGSLTNGLSKGSSFLDMDVAEAAAILSEKLDESIFENVVIPMFKASQLYCATDKVKMDSPTNIDRVFTVQNLFDLYELIYLVGKFQFCPFFATLAGLITSRINVEEAKQKVIPEK